MSTTTALRPPRPRLVQLLRQAEVERIAGQQTAMRLMREVPGWLVMWGSGSRLFHAFPLWAGATRQSSEDPDKLIRLMRQEQSTGAIGRDQSGRLIAGPGVMPPYASNAPIDGGSDA